MVLLGVIPFLLPPMAGPNSVPKMVASGKWKEAHQRSPDGLVLPHAPSNQPEKEIHHEGAPEV